MAAAERDSSPTRLLAPPRVTERLSATSGDDVARAAEILRGGGIVALPTETVYGLAGNALDPAVVGKIYAAKGRPSDNPLIVHVRGIDDVGRLVHEIPDQARELATQFWPGPLSIVMPKSAIVPPQVTGGAETVAVRAPDNDAFQAVLQAAGVPLAAPSANRAGAPSPTTAEHVLADLDGRIDAVLDGGPCRVGVESTVVSLVGVNGCCAPASGPQHDGKKSAAVRDIPGVNGGETIRIPRLLRPGGISLEQLRGVLGPVAVDPGVTGSLAEDVVPGAPGMKYRHYAPPAPLAILTGPLPVAARYVGEYVEEHPGQTTAVLCPAEEAGEFLTAVELDEPPQGDTPPRLRVVAYGSLTDHDSLAHGLFAALRELSTPEIGRIFARLPEGDDGINLATRNRLKKAAGFVEIDATGRRQNAERVF